MAVARDITERRNSEAQHQRLQSQLQHAVKMESIGRLAGGVAHDFNNLLTAIMGNADLAANMARTGRDVREALQGIREASKSATMLARQLLAFLRKHVGEPRLVNMNELILRMHTSQALAKSHPETRTLFTSGYTENVIAHHGVSEKGIAFLGNPYSLDDLVRRVRKLLDE